MCTLCVCRVCVWHFMVSRIDVEIASAYFDRDGVQLNFVVVFSN